MADPLEQERAVLSALLLDSSRDNSALRDARGVLSSGDFTDGRHSAIYAAMCDVIDGGGVATTATVARALEAKGVLAVHGGKEFLASLLEGNRTHALPIAKAIRGRALLREIAYMGRDAEMQAMDDNADPGVLIDALQRKLLALSGKAHGDGFRDANEVKAEVMAEFRRIADSPDGIIGLRTGLRELDELVGGLRGGWLVLVGARTGEGKTILGTVVSEWVAKSDEAVAFFSIEMAASQLMQRRVCAEAGVPIQSARSMLRGAKGQETWQRLEYAAEEVAMRPVYVDDSSVQTIPKIRAACRRIQQKQGLSLVVVDYLQLVKPTEKKERRDLDIGEMSAGLKAIAKDFDVPVLALCQLGRKADGQRPSLVHFRESGNLEQDADVAILIHHPEPDPMAPDPESELIVAKNRHGAVGVAHVRFNRSLATFKDTAPVGIEIFG